MIQNFEELITAHEQIRAGFIAFALEKNRRSTPLIKNAKAFRCLALRAKEPKDLLKISEIRHALLTASGLSDKALAHFTEDDKSQAILELIENFLEPAGNDFVDEVIYRYLLTKGDSLGGSMRNIVGAFAQQKLTRFLLSTLSNAGITYRWLSQESKKWKEKPDNDFAIEEKLKCISWRFQGKERVLAFNLMIPIVNNNIDICLFDATEETYAQGVIVKFPENIIMLGELKGGIDPAGADEHWKTGNSALNRIREAFERKNLKIKTSFIAAAIERKMASEIFRQLQGKILSKTANLTIDNQVIDYCSWIVNL